MKGLARNHLVWIDALAWKQIEDRVWDPQAQEILAHWRVNNLPLVVCRQRAETTPDQVCVGLPAPTQWSRRRLALMLNLSSITVCGVFPTLMQVARANHWGRVAQDLGLALSNSGVQAHVYGSHGWQFLTGLPYLHVDSDIDLSLSANDFDTACQVLQRLAAAKLPWRIDGEIVFPAGQAIAWRELQQMVAGQTSQVMVKDRHGIRLAALEEVRQLGRGAQHVEPKTALALN